MRTGKTGLMSTEKVCDLFAHGVENLAVGFNARFIDRGDGAVCWLTHGCGLFVMFVEDE